MKNDESINKKDYGLIINDILDISSSSPNHTWFIEKEMFINGIYSQKDLEELNNDISKLKSIYGEEINCMVESLDSWQEAKDCVVIFYEDFISLFGLTLKSENMEHLYTILTKDDEIISIIYDNANDELYIFNEDNRKRVAEQNENAVSIINKLDVKEIIEISENFSSILLMILNEKKELSDSELMLFDFCSDNNMIL